jgi:iron(III) transport system permease protein
VIPLIIPGILFTVAWILLGSPKIGLVNLVLQRVFDTEAVFVNVYSLWGMIWVDGLHYSPVAFLLMTAAFRAMDPALEESAVMSGASVPQVAARITLPLVWPAIFATILILFVRAIESFEVPALLGLPVGIQVFTSAIYQAVHRYPSQIGLASALATTLLLITTVGVYFQSRSSRGSKYATMTGKGFRPRTIDPPLALSHHRDLPRLLPGDVVPFAVLLWSSLQKFYAVPSMEALAADARSVPHHPVVSQPDALGVERMLLAIGSATIIMLVTR